MSDAASPLSAVRGAVSSNSNDVAGFEATLKAAGVVFGEDGKTVSVHVPLLEKGNKRR